MIAYSTLRPVSIGTYPKGYEVVRIENFDARARVPEIEREAWGLIEFAGDVPEEVLARFDLVVREPENPRFGAAVDAMRRYWERGDADRCAKVLDTAADRYGIDREKLYSAFEAAIA